MGAECFVCGHDLPYDGECSYCALKARAESAEARCESYREALEAIAGSDPWPGLSTVELGVSSSHGRYKSLVARAALAVPQEGKR